MVFQQFNSETKREWLKGRKEGEWTYRLSTSSNPGGSGLNPKTFNGQRNMALSRGLDALSNVKMGTAYDTVIKVGQSLVRKDPWYRVVAKGILAAEGYGGAVDASDAIYDFIDKNTTKGSYINNAAHYGPVPDVNPFYYLDKE